MKFLTKLFAPDIFECIEQGKVSRIKKLISGDRSLLNKQNAQGNTPLMHAVDCMQLQATKFLLESGAKINIQDNEGNTALSICTMWDSAECAKELIKHRADVTSKDKKGVSILMKAAYYGSPELMELLLAHGANIHHIDDDGNSVLIWAIQGESILSINVEFLLEQGADKYYKNPQGKTALDFLYDIKDEFEEVEEDIEEFKIVKKMLSTD